MNRWLPLLAALGLLWSARAAAHIGSPNAIFEGEAGPYPVRVIVRPPGVVPGLAQISVRVLTNTAQRVTVLPVHWRAGLAGAPPPDVAHPVDGVPGLFESELWLMTSGAYSVHVEVEGARGRGIVMVPVLSVATQRKEMPIYLGALLLGFTGLLVATGIAIVGAALRESVLTPGEPLTRRRVWIGRAAMGVAFLVFAVGLGAGRAWWTSVDRQYRSNRLYEAASITATQTPEGLLRLVMQEPEGRRSHGPLLPDHGKMMHLYLIREPDMDVIAHLHPSVLRKEEFETCLPPLPQGRYTLYADVTHETGFSATLTNTIVLETPTAAYQPSDPDDSWTSTPDAQPAGGVRSLDDGMQMTLEPSSWKAGQESALRFRLENNGQPVPLDLYMGMLGHAAVRHRDGTVFAHLHPAGSISVASQQLFQLRARGGPTQLITAQALEEFCRTPTWQERQQTLSFPYEFPRPGPYRVWVQVKAQDRILTAGFDLTVDQ